MNRHLPTSLDGLRGLRAARWVRESTRGQYDNYGPEAQRDQQDRAIDRYGLVDTGIEWVVAHSGRTVASTAQFGEMMERAGKDYDILVVGYVSRFARDARTTFNARHDLHLAGAAILFADERVLTSDDDRWDEFARETIEAESYSRRLGRRVREGYAAKFQRLADPGGNAPFGFVRTDEKPKTLRIEPEAMTIVVRMFERYAVGTISFEQLADEFGMNADAVKEMIRNPIYNGWVRRHGGERVPAPWRNKPPISDELWERTAALRARRARGGGQRVPGRVDPLRGILRCSCGASMAAWGMVRGKHRRIHHPKGCPDGVTKRVWSNETWEPWVFAQLRSLNLDEKTLADVGAAIGSPDRANMPDLDRYRIERERRDLAMQMAKGQISAEEFIARIEAVAEAPSEPGSAEVSAEDAVAYLRDFAETWAKLDEMGDAGRALKADLVATVYDEITVRGEEFVDVRLTPTAYAHGLALALPERVRMELARPEGFEPPTY